MTERRAGTVVAIDGPAGSGKSTVARHLAAARGYRYLDTGAMYRALTFSAIRQGIDPGDSERLASLATSCVVEFEDRGLPEAPRVLVDGDDVTSAIRAPEVSALVSLVSSVPEVRRAMVERQRRFAAGGDTVVEGRDIGTVVLPQAKVKLYITASPEERARRRQKDLSAAGVMVGEEALGRQMARRDEIDSSRQASPLKKAEDAVLIDTTSLSIEEVVEQVDSLVERVLSLR